jgi:hypothetical protein
MPDRSAISTCDDKSAADYPAIAVAASGSQDADVLFNEVLHSLCSSHPLKEEA